MDLSSRIEKIKPFFVSFNVVAEESAAYAVVKFPKNWMMPDVNSLRENFKIEIAPIANGTCFVTEIGNGGECIFDAIDYVISFNKQLEATKDLFDAKKEELRKLFTTEPLERLKNLRFVIDPQKNAPKKPKKPKTSVEEKVETEPIKEETAETHEVEQPKEPDNSLMSLAKSITE